MSTDLLRFPAVRQAVSLSRSTIFRMERKNQFPARLQLGPNSVAWKRDEIETGIKSRTKVGRQS
jgi:predicted DNA-binding transcriptional regulator AlpA